MKQQISPHDYYYGHEANQYTFYRLPKALFTDSRYKHLSDGAKILYGLMLDRMGLSIKNGWLDEQDRVFIYFTLVDAQEYMNCGHNKGVKLMGELDDIGLIERIKQGQGKPAMIFVKKFFTHENEPYQKEGTDDDPQGCTQPKNHFPKGETQASDNGKSKFPQNGSADCHLAEGNKNYKNNTEKNYIYPKTVPFGDRTITIENLTPILPTKERERRKREIEKRLFDVFSKYANKRCK